MGFIAFFQAAQNRNRIFNAWLADHHRLETPFKCGIFFDIFAIFVQRGRADGVQFAACQRRLEHI